MKKLKEKIDISLIEILSILTILCVLTIVGVGSILVTYGSLKLKQLSYFLLFFIPIEIVLYIINKIYYRTFNKKEILLFLLYLFSTLSLFGSNNLRVSVWGFLNRYEGLLMMYSYYSIALLASTIKSDYYKKIIISVILIIGFINVGYGLLQTKLISLSIPIKDSWKYARGFQGNSMYFASLISICFFFVIAMFVFSKKKIDWKISILLIFFTFGNAISGSMALFCTTIFLFILLIGYEIYLLRKKLFSKVRFIKIFICIFLFAIISVFYYYQNLDYQRDVKTLSKEVTNIQETKEQNNQFGTGRIYIWKQVLNKTKNHLLFGVGIDNVFYSFNPKLIDPVSGYAVDKAHNDYLQKLLCEGVFSFICYIIFLILIVLDNFRTENHLRRVIFLGFFAYITQIFFSISVIRVSPIYWILVGLLMSDEIRSKNKKRKKV